LKHASAGARGKCSSRGRRGSLLDASKVIP
jgi:hypothetical protein